MQMRHYFEQLSYKGADVRHPLWIANSAMLVLFVLSVIFVYFSRVELPVRTPINPHKYSKGTRELSTDINIKKIYEQDLFDTYKKESAPAPAAAQEPGITFPEPPTPAPPVQSTIPEPKFLDPLNITLKGIVIIGSDNSRSSALIADNKSGAEAIYRIGDSFEDAVLVRILNNKVLFLRSNGQQEVLYLRAEDAKQDALFTSKDEWSRIITAEGTDSFFVDPKEFVQQVKSLGQFIDMLHLTTVYEKGKSVGCRIGTIDDKSFGTAMGLLSGDIVTHINDIATGPVDNRMQIYQMIVAMTEGSIIRVALTRDGKPKTIVLILRAAQPKSTPSAEEQNELSLQKQKNDERINILKEKYQVAPTLQDLRKREREHMRNQDNLPEGQTHAL